MGRLSWHLSNLSWNSWGRFDESETHVILNIQQCVPWPLFNVDKLENPAPQTGCTLQFRVLRHTVTKVPWNSCWWTPLENLHNCCFILKNVWLASDLIKCGCRVFHKLLTKQYKNFFFPWDLSVIGLVIVLKFTEIVFTSLGFLTLWLNWPNFFGYFEINLVCDDRKQN